MNPRFKIIYVQNKLKLRWATPDFQLSAGIVLVKWVNKIKNDVYIVTSNCVSKLYMANACFFKICTVELVVGWLGT